MEYRVFDKKRKKWVNDDIYLNPDGELLKADKSILGWSKPTFVSQDRYVYQKAIDLNDKNGNMIHVGDILDAKVDTDRIVRGMVTFAAELSAYIILCFDTDEYFTLGTDVCEFIEIVGNIFEELKERKEPKKKKNKSEKEEIF